MPSSLFRRLALLLALCASPALHAESLVQLSVIDRDTGLSLPEWPHRGDRWVEGAPGHHYALRLTNLTGARVLAIVSVDGVNVVSGQTAQADQGGYVLAPWQTTQINGWRKSLQEVAQFVFTDLQDSYAARTGRPDNVGVIGVAAFREQAVPFESPAMVAPQARADAASAPFFEGEATKAQRLGTGHGARESAQATATTFVRASARPQQQDQLRYDARRRLVALGVLPRGRDMGPQSPQAFPGGFVPDP